MSGKDFTKHHNREEQEWRIDGDIGYIQLYNRVGERTEEAIIDADFMETARKYKWYCTRKYVTTSNRAGTVRAIRLHRLVMGVHNKSYPFIDHINGNPLDNRRANLREATYQQSAMNVSGRRPAGYKGVGYDKWASPGLKNKWRSKIQFGGKQIEVGRFETAEEAAWMYDQYALALFGDYARLNFEYV